MLTVTYQMRVCDVTEMAFSNNTSLETSCKLTDFAKKWPIPFQPAEDGPQLHGLPANGHLGLASTHGG